MASQPRVMCALLRRDGVRQTRVMRFEGPWPQNTGPMRLGIVTAGLVSACHADGTDSRLHIHSCSEASLPIEVSERVGRELAAMCAEASPAASVSGLLLGFPG